MALLSEKTGFISDVQQKTATSESNVNYIDLGPIGFRSYANIKGRIKQNKTINPNPAQDYYYYFDVIVLKINGISSVGSQSIKDKDNVSTSDFLFRFEGNSLRIYPDLVPSTTNELSVQYHVMHKNQGMSFANIDISQINPGFVISATDQQINGEKIFASSVDNFLESSVSITIGRYSEKNINVKSNIDCLLDSTLRKGQKIKIFNNSDISGFAKDEKAANIKSSNSSRYALARIFPKESCEITVLKDAPTEPSHFYVNIKRDAKDAAVQMQQEGTIAFSFKDIVWSKSLGLFVGVGHGGISTSPDGKNWAIRHTGGSFDKIAWAEETSTFMAIDDASLKIYKSNDAISWTVSYDDSISNLLDYNEMLDLAWSAEFGTFVVSGRFEFLYYKPGSGSWGRDYAGGVIYNNIVWAKEKGVFLSTGSNTASVNRYIFIYGYSDAGGLVTETDFSFIGDSANFDFLTWSSLNGKFAGISNSDPGFVYESDRGDTWTKIAIEGMPAGANFTSFEWNKDLKRYVGFDNQGKAYTGKTPSQILVSPTSLAGGVVVAWSPELHMWAGSLASSPEAVASKY